MTQAFSFIAAVLASAAQAAAASEITVLPLRAPGLHDMLLADVAVPLTFLAFLLAILCLPRRASTRPQRRSD